jgi:hypothetical protein
MSRKRAEWYIKDADGLNRREREFCLYYAASGLKLKAWAAKKAGFGPDYAKRGRDLLERPAVQAWLDKYKPPQNVFKVTSEKTSIIKRLEQIASCEGVNAKTASIELKAIELMGRAQNLWDGGSAEGRDRLAEVIKVFSSGPVGQGVCGKCQKNYGTGDQYCRYCGALIPKEPTPVDKLAAAQKKVGVKKEVLQ